MTDEYGGRFFIGRISPGLHSLKFQAIGFDPVTIDIAVRAGETTRVDQVLTLPVRVRERRALNARILSRLRASTTMTVYRLDPRQAIWTDPPPPGTLGRLGRYAIVSESRLRSAHDRHRFIALITDTLSWARGPAGIKLCTPEPGVGVRFRGPGGVTDFEFCLECAVAFVQAEGAGSSGGDFDPILTQMLAFFRRAFPRDSVLKELAQRNLENERRYREQRRSAKRAISRRESRR